MSLFSVFGIAGSGVTVHRKWLDAVADNLANVNTVRSTNEEAFRARYVLAQAVDYGNGTGGVAVAGTALGNAEGRIVYDPQHPLADENGNVRLPDIDLAAQMTQLIVAQRGYQASLAVVDRARDAYSAAIQVGRA
ncbi:flagellar basal body rod protein FlgC [Sporichthya polymorpha]|uniref:flagellar basal body rod protein FlgC n=1 Tax=Sporichthya polymorpha TaxID=35751 RepID=UPI000491D7C3|nr:flagellar basal body rod C-terminal domain-containing protein [Sporichthya polymorpha]